MRFPRAAIIFMVSAFAFFIMFAISSRMITEVGTAVDPHDNTLPASYNETMALLPTAFGVISAIFFVCGILAVFFLDSLGEEYEYYDYRRR